MNSMYVGIYVFYFDKFVTRCNILKHVFLAISTLGSKTTLQKKVQLCYFIVKIMCIHPLNFYFISIFCV